MSHCVCDPLGSVPRVRQAAVKHAAGLPEAARRGADLATVALKAASAQLAGAVTMLHDAGKSL